MRYLFHVLLLGSFWLALSGHFSMLLAGLGILSVALVLGILMRMDRADGEAPFLRPTPRLIGYGLWLVGAVVKANIDVARRIWDPKLPVRPVWQRLDTKVETPMERTLYANSITLTPGTLTTDVHEDHFLVHALSPSDMGALRDSSMESRIRDLRI